MHLVLCPTLPWLGPQAIGMGERQGKSDKGLAGDRGASGMTRGAKVAGAIEVVVLLLSALLAAASCEGAGWGALRSSWEVAL